MSLRSKVKSNAWSCVITAFSMATDISTGELVKIIGHDGGEKVNDLEEPMCRRGFHPQEIIQAVWQLGWATTPIELRPRMSNYDRGKPDMVVDSTELFEKTINESRGVMLGEGRRCWHAFAFDQGTVYDPDNGNEHEFKFQACEARNYKPKEALVITRIPVQVGSDVATKVDQ